MKGSEHRSEPFLARWSRLKRKEPAQGPTDPPDTSAGAAAAVPDRPPPREGEAPPAPIDLASLPPIESITAGSDIRAFLQSGVPAELTRAALRRAWTSDPAIRDFIGIAENQWDFTDPAGIPGFGPLEPTTDVVALARQALGQIEPPGLQPPGAGSGAATGAEPAPQQAFGIPDRNRSAELPEEPVEAQQNAPPAAAQHAAPATVASAAPSRRAHGGALPK